MTKATGKSEPWRLAEACGRRDAGAHPICLDYWVDRLHYECLDELKREVLSGQRCVLCVLKVERIVFIDWDLMSDLLREVRPGNVTVLSRDLRLRLQLHLPQKCKL